MPRTMFDSVTASNIPTDAQMVAGYVDPGGMFTWTDADWARFPTAIKVRIAGHASTNDGHVLDVEAGDATPDQAPGWVTMRRSAGVTPTVYCSEAAWASVKQAFAAQGVPEPEWWIAGYPGSVGVALYPGAVAHQYRDVGPYDLSIVADFWPGVDTATPTPTSEDDPVDYISQKSSSSGAIYVTDWQTKRHVNPAEWSLAQVLAGLAGKPAPPVLPLDDDTWANIPIVGTATIDAGALATTIAAAVAAKFPAGSGLTDAQIRADVHAEVVAILHSVP